MQSFECLVTRDEWLLDVSRHNYGLRLLGVNANFLPAEIIAPTDRSSAVDVLRHAIANQHLESYDELRVALGSSPFWNDIVGGRTDVGEFVRFYGEADTVKYLSDRATNVHARNYELITQYPDIVTTFIDGVRLGKILGYIPEEITDGELEEASHSVGVCVSDRYVIELSHGGVPIDGDYSRAKNLIRLSSSSKQEDVVRVIVHELRHQISGGTFKLSGNNPDLAVIERTRTGFQSNGRHRALDEALVEHTTCAILNGNWGILDPRLRSERSAYHEERILLAELLLLSGGIINFQDLMRASFEDTFGGGGVSDRRTMVSQFRRAFGPGSIHRYNKLVNYVLSNYRDQPIDAMIEKFQEYINPPTVDSNGNVQIVGEIVGDFMTDSEEIEVA